MIMWNLLFFFSRQASHFQLFLGAVKTQIEGLGVHLPLRFINGGVGDWLPASPFRPLNFQTPSMALGPSFVSEMMADPLESASSSLCSAEIHEVSCAKRETFP